MKLEIMTHIAFLQVALEVLLHLDLSFVITPRLLDANWLFDKAEYLGWRTENIRLYAPQFSAYNIDQLLKSCRWRSRFQDIKRRSWTNKQFP